MMQENHDKWDDVYFEYLSSANRPEYDYRLWKWMKENYYAPQKIKNEEKNNTESEDTGGQKVSSDSI